MRTSFISTALCIVAAHIPKALAAQCFGSIGQTLDDTQIWDLRAQVCNNPSCATGSICATTVAASDATDPWGGDLGFPDTPKLEINIYTQTGQFDSCWDALSDIITQCNRNGQIAGEWDDNGEAYWIVNNMDQSGNAIINSNVVVQGNDGTRDWQDNPQWVGGSGTFEGDWYCMSGCLSGCTTNKKRQTGGCSQQYSWSKTITTTLTVGGSFDVGIDEVPLLDKIGAAFDSSYSWSVANMQSSTTTCNPDVSSFVVQARPLMGYSFGFGVGLQGGKGYAAMKFSPYHVNTQLFDSNTNSPQLNWNCSGQCDGSTFNPQCITY